MQQEIEKFYDGPRNVKKSPTEFNQETNQLQLN